MPVLLASGPITGDRSGPNPGGFVLMPAGTLVADPAVIPTWGKADPNSIDLAGTPPLHGGSGPSYDLALKRWLPAPWALVSSDGRSYLYWDSDGRSVGVTATFRIHVVDAITGTDRVVHSGDKLVPIDFRKEGIYAVASRWESSSAGLYRIDPGSGAVTTIRTTGAWMAVGEGVAWGTESTWTLGEANSRIDALDLKTGALQTWLPEQPELSRWVVAIDSKGRPVISGSSRSLPQRAWIDRLESPGQMTTIYEVAGSGGYGQIVPDGPILWIWTGDAVLRYEPGSGVRTAFTGRIQSVAGTCRR